MINNGWIDANGNIVSVKVKLKEKRMFMLIF